ncbi:MAG: hypothetical protein PVS2B1_18780 [Candidatus Dormibacteraceae bacterium]
MREFDQEIADLDGQVAVISFGRPDHLKRFAAHLGHPYLWLADPERRSYRSLELGRKGLLAIAPPRVIWAHVRFAFRGKIWHPEQLDVAQMGGDFVFDRGGELSLRHLSSASDDRPAISVVMSALRQAAGSSADEGDR